MKALGRYFREQREEKGYTLRDVARETNINTRYLEAIENEEFDVFPAPVYAKGFIRSYADFLRLDPEALVVEYELNFQDTGDDPEPTSTAGRNRVYWLSLFGGSVLALFVIFFRFAWVYPESVEPGADRARTAVETSYASSSERPSVAVFPTHASEARQGNASSSPSEAPETFQVQPEHLQVEVEAVEKTWLYVIFDGITKREMMLQKGDHVTWEAEDTIRMRLGNAGGIRLFYQGRRLPKLGESGEVTDKILTLQDGELTIRPVGYQGDRTAP